MKSRRHIKTGTKEKLRNRNIEMALMQKDG